MPQYRDAEPVIVQLDVLMLLKLSVLNNDKLVDCLVSL